MKEILRKVLGYGLIAAMTIPASIGITRDAIKDVLSKDVAVLADQLPNIDYSGLKLGPNRPGFMDNRTQTEEWAAAYDEIGLGSKYTGQEGRDLSISQLKDIKRKLEAEINNYFNKYP